VKGEGRWNGPGRRTARTTGRASPPAPVSSNAAVARSQHLGRCASGRDHARKPQLPSARAAGTWAWMIPAETDGPPARAGVEAKTGNQTIHGPKGQGAGGPAQRRRADRLRVCRKTARSVARSPMWPKCSTIKRMIPMIELEPLTTKGSPVSVGILNGTSRTLRRRRGAAPWCGRIGLGAHRRGDRRLWMISAACSPTM